MSTLKASRKLRLGLLVLLFFTLLLLILSALLTPSNFIQTRLCSIPFYDSSLSDTCRAIAGSSGRISSSPLQPLDYADGNFKTKMYLSVSINVISLARRTDRRRTMESLSKALKLEWNYFDALDKDDALVNHIIHSVVEQRTKTRTYFKWPETLEDVQHVPFYADNATHSNSTSTPEPLVCATGDNNITSYENVSSIPFHMRLSRGMIACWYSHMYHLIDIVKRVGHIRRDTWDGREGISIVFEDDIDVEWDFKQRLERIWAELPRDWDIVMLGHCWSNESTNPPLTPTSPLHPSHRPKCTHGYALSPHGARKLLTHLSYAPFAFSRALDQAIAHLISTYRIRSYSVVPSIVIQRRRPFNTSTLDYLKNTGFDGDSDIWIDEGRRGSQWKDTLNDSALERIRDGAFP